MTMVTIKVCGAFSERLAKTTTERGVFPQVHRFRGATSPRGAACEHLREAVGTIESGGDVELWAALPDDVTIVELREVVILIGADLARRGAKLRVELVL